MVEDGGETHQGHFDATSVSMEYENQETAHATLLIGPLQHWFTNRQWFCPFIWLACVCCQLTAVGNY
jgi:hypothetical protein